MEFYSSHVLMAQDIANCLRQTIATNRQENPFCRPTKIDLCLVVNTIKSDYDWSTLILSLREKINVDAQISIYHIPREINTSFDKTKVVKSKLNLGFIIPIEINKNSVKKMSTLDFLKEISRAN